MSIEAYRSPVDVMALLVRDGQVLLALRQGTGYADGQWNLPSGKLEDGEDARSAVIREAAEEVGVVLDPLEVRYVCTLHHRNPEGQGRIGLFFSAERWAGEPYNAEPHKCAKLGWFALDMLPATTVPYTAAGVALWLRQESFGLSGW